MSRGCLPQDGAKLRKNRQIKKFLLPIAIYFAKIHEKAFAILIIQIIWLRAHLINKSHLEFQLILARYFGNDANAEKILACVEKVYKKDLHDKKTIEYHNIIKFSLEEWRKRMYEFCDNKEAFMAVCRKNSEDKNVRKLNMGVLIDEPPIIKTSAWEKVTNLFRR